MPPPLESGKHARHTNRRSIVERRLPIYRADTARKGCRSRSVTTRSCAHVSPRSGNTCPVDADALPSHCRRAAIVSTGGAALQRTTSCDAVGHGCPCMSGKRPRPGGSGRVRPATTRSPAGRAATAPGCPAPKGPLPLYHLATVATGAQASHAAGSRRRAIARQCDIVPPAYRPRRPRDNSRGARAGPARRDIAGPRGILSFLSFIAHHEPRP